MAVNAEEYRKYERDRKRTQRARRPAAPREFVGVDGEGGDINGRHRYLLLRAGAHYVENPRELGPIDCLDFLSSLPHGPLYISYYFDYDVTMICRGLPPSRIKRLLDREGRGKAKDGTRLNQPLPVDVAGGLYQIDYLPRKFFKVRKWLGDAEGYTKWIEISDISAFFQCSFVKALKDWEVTDAETLAQIERGKARRSDFEALTDETRAYNQAEVNLLADLATRFRDVCQDVGYSPAKWQGPGYLAVAMFRAHDIPKTRDLPPAPTEIWEAANAAYYGGRFEITGVGPVQGPVYQYDINSAYPDAIQKLPCLRHSTWAEGIVDGARYVLLNGTFAPKSEAMLYGLPIRDEDGGIYFPAFGGGWYWQHEIKEARHQSFTVKRAYSVIEACECVPFSWVPEVYAERLTLGKTAKGKILKLALNSLYGKMAQSIGGAPYANPVYASLITSMTRAKLMSAVHSSLSCSLGICGDDAYMLATDALFVSHHLPLAVSKNLGEWDLETHEAGMFIIQPGVYFTSDLAKPKTRGLPQRVVVENLDRFRAAFQDLLNVGDPTPVAVKLSTFIGLRQAFHRNKPEQAGTWVKPCDRNPAECEAKPCCSKSVSFLWEAKRSAVTLDMQGETALRPLPIRGAPGLASVPYSREIGRWRELDRLDYWDQPDFGSDTFREGED